MPIALQAGIESPQQVLSVCLQISMVYESCVRRAVMFPSSFSSCRSTSIVVSSNLFFLMRQWKVSREYCP